MFEGDDCAREPPLKSWSSYLSDMRESLRLSAETSRMQLEEIHFSCSQYESFTPHTQYDVCEWCLKRYQRTEKHYPHCLFRYMHITHIAKCRLAYVIASIRTITNKASFRDLFAVHPELESRWNCSLASLKNTDKRYIRILEDEKRDAMQGLSPHIFGLVENCANAICERWLEKRSDTLRKNGTSCQALVAEFENRVSTSEMCGRSLDPSLHSAAMKLEDYTNGCVSYADIGGMNSVCRKCGAKLFSGEVRGEGRYGICCNRIKERHIPEPIEFENDDHKRLFSDQTFLKNSYRLNSYHQMAKALHTPHKLFSNTRGIHNIVVKGKGVKKIMGLSDDAETRNQTWFVGGYNEQDRALKGLQEMERIPELERDTTLYQDIMTMLKDNCYVRMFRRASVLMDSAEENTHVAINFDDLRGPEKTGREYANAAAEDELRAVYTVSTGTEDHKYAEGWGRQQYSVIMQGEAEGEGEGSDKYSRKISDFDARFEPLCFPLIHVCPKDSTGWRHSRKDEATPNPYSGVSAQEYGCFHLFSRATEKNPDGEPGPALIGRKLTEYFFLQLGIRAITQRISYHSQQIVKKYATKEFLEESRVTTVVENRRVTTHDATNDTTTATTTLYASYPRGKRARIQDLNDSLALKARLGCPDYFLTMTANPHWPEILRELRPGERPCDRSDLVHRVFNLKMDQLERKLKENALGTYQAMVRVVEYQKRGLPHLHLLLWVSKEHKGKEHKPSAAIFDMAVSCQLPDPETQEELYNLVSEQMMHTKCDTVPSARCKVPGPDGNARCKQHYPKNFRDDTLATETGMYSYGMRPNNGRTSAVAEKDQERARKLATEGKVHPSCRDNRYVVSYNIVLLTQFMSHFNIEAVGSPVVIRYLFKYLFKDDEYANVSVSAKDGEKNKTDECMSYLTGIHIGSLEAIGYLLGTKMRYIDPSVTRLDVHLAGQQRLYYFPGKEAEALDKATDTTLTAWFAANSDAKRDPSSKYQGIQTLNYITVPEYFAFSRDKAEWTLRKSYVYCPRTESLVTTDRSRAAKSHLLAIGRLYRTPVLDKELQALRTILMVRKGPTSFDDLMTVEGKKCESFTDAANEMGLLQDGELVKLTLVDAVKTTVSGRCLRFTLAVLLNSFAIPPNNMKELWKTYKVELCKRPLKQGETAPDEDEATVSEQEENEALLDIQNVLRNICGSDVKLEVFGLPTPTAAVRSANDGVSWVMKDEIYNMEKQWQEWEKIEPKLNTKQRDAVQRVQLSVTQGKGEMFLLQGAAGTGKTFTYQAMLSWCRSHRGVPAQGDTHRPNIALAVASSGIAAMLLPGGRTSHNRFKFPLDLYPDDHHSVCKLTKEIEDLIRATDLIVFDEVVMANRGHIELLDRTCRKVTGKAMWFGGITVVLGGDFKQILPVTEGDKSATLKNCLHTSPLFQNMTMLSLIEIMRQKDDKEWATYLGTIGDGSRNDRDSSISLPINLYRKNCGNYVVPDDLITHVFPLIGEGVVGNGMILAPTNKAQKAMNNICLKRLCGKQKEVLHEFQLTGKDTCTEESVEGESAIDSDVMNAYQQTGIPDHCITVKVGAPLMLLKNLNPPKGLCNGTRFIVTGVTQLNIQGIIVGDPQRVGMAVNIPRVKNTPDEKKAGFSMQRVQFPVALSFASTINKSQGQTLDRVGLDLTESQCFAHGQLYVALSRCPKAKHVKVAVPLKTRTTANRRIVVEPYRVSNPVYKDMLKSVSDRGLEGIFMQLTETEEAMLQSYHVMTDKEYSEQTHRQAKIPLPDQKFWDPMPMQCESIQFEDAEDLVYVAKKRKRDPEDKSPKKRKKNNSTSAETTTAQKPKLSITRVLGDGTCFYHAVDQSITKRIGQGNQLRRELELFVVQNSTTIKHHPLIVPENANTVSSIVGTYNALMNRITGRIDGTYATSDYAEQIEFALVSLLKRVLITIVKMNQDNKPSSFHFLGNNLSTEQVLANIPAKDRIILLHTSNPDHFNIGTGSPEHELETHENGLEQLHRGFPNEILYQVDWEL